MKGHGVVRTVSERPQPLGDDLSFGEDWGHLLCPEVPMMCQRERAGACAKGLWLEGRQSNRASVRRGWGASAWTTMGWW
jgi:hypothetical protein